MKLKTHAAIVLAVGLTLSGVAQAAGSHNGGGGHAGGGGAAAHFSGGSHFGGHGGGHGGHFGGHHGGRGYGYGYGALGFGLGLGLGTLYYDDYGNDGYDGYGPVIHDYHDNYPDDSVPPPQAEQGPPPDVPGYWYRCDDPAGYYPYVGICPHPWQAVPAVPPPPPPPTD